MCVVLTELAGQNQKHQPTNPEFMWHIFFLVQERDICWSPRWCWACSASYLDVGRTLVWLFPDQRACTAIMSTDLDRCEPRDILTYSHSPLTATAHLLGSLNYCATLFSPSLCTQVNVEMNTCIFMAAPCFLNTWKWVSRIQLNTDNVRDKREQKSHWKTKAHKRVTRWIGCEGGGGGGGSVRASAGEKEVGMNDI